MEMTEQRYSQILAEVDQELAGYGIGPLAEHESWLIHFMAEVATSEETAAALNRKAAEVRGAERRPVGPCECECNRGGFCGGCGHAGCGRR